MNHSGRTAQPPGPANWNYAPAHASIALTKQPAQLRNSGIPWGDVDESEALTKGEIMKRVLNQNFSGWLLAALLSCGAGGEIARAQSDAAKPAATAPVVKFRPPTSGAASVRVTGGSRGAGTDAMVLEVLAPDEVGITTQEQPSLFWYQSKPANAKFELTVLQDNQAKPLVQVQVERAAAAGIQRLKLSEQSAKLAPGVEYQWVIALVTDPENRSKDLVASGVIKRIEPAAGLKEKLSKADPDALAGIYADSGIWYDALAALSDRIDADPGNTALWKARSDLLSQVGLKAAALAPGTSKKD